MPANDFPMTNNNTQGTDMTSRIPPYYANELEVQRMTGTTKPNISMHCYVSQFPIPKRRAVRPTLLVLLAIACLLWAATASATDKPVAVSPPTATATANGGYADSWSDADSNAVSVSDAHASQHQDQTATANNEGNHQSTVITHKAVKQAPSAYASASNATLSCFRPVGLSASIPGVGAGFTAGKLNKDCLLLTAADEELRRGNLSASIAFRCKTKLYRETLGEDCPALLNTQTKASVTREYVQETVEKAFKSSVAK
jgi:hypothetical protein